VNRCPGVAAAAAAAAATRVQQQQVGADALLTLVGSSKVTVIQ
jgi:hypothetical protein